jgi:hypothetical protein
MTCHFARIAEKVIGLVDDLCGPNGRHWEARDPQ